MSTIPLILNPAAGGGACGAQAEAAVAKLAAGGVHVDVLPTNGPGHATALAQQAWAAGYRTILCAGGDGTTYEVVNGLFPLEGEARPVIGTLPLGTGNSFLKDFGIEDADTAIQAVVEDRRHAVDVVRITHREGVLHYINLLSIGFTSEVGQTTNRWFKPLGTQGYTVATVLEVVRLKARRFPHQLDDGPVDNGAYDFLSFNNSRCTGGDMIMAPDADVSDGKLDVIRVGDLGRLGLLKTFPAIYSGTHLAHPKNSATTAQSVTFQLDEPVAIMVDGEVLTVHLERLDVLPGALEVLA